MPTSLEIINSIEASLRQAVGPGLSTSSEACDAYEVFILGVVLDACRGVGGMVEFKNVGNRNFNGTFTFCTGPGNIYSRAHPYTYARINFPNSRPLEAHIGVYAAGVFGVRHECDVALLTFDEAENCRRNQAHPRCSEIKIAVECKFYSSELGIDLGRSFLGLTKEIHHHDRFFVTNSSSITLERLLAHHKVRWMRELVPARNDLVIRLRAGFEEVLQNYLALR